MLITEGIIGVGTVAAIALIFAVAYLLVRPYRAEKTTADENEMQRAAIAGNNMLTFP